MNDFDLCLEVVQRSCQPLRRQYLQNYFSRLELARDFKFSLRLCMGAQIIFPKSGRGLGHVTPQFWHTIEHIFKTI